MWPGFCPPPFSVEREPKGNRDARPPRRAREILKHYLKNPAAADTLEGIAGWRLLEEIVQRRVDETEEALRWLVANGYLESSEGAAAGPVYRLNIERRADGERFVAPVKGRATAVRKDGNG
ncbi:MAG: hypothetical protein ACREAA_02105 [Candidatus Polarisedimenticolia bacterium]